MAQKRCEDCGRFMALTDIMPEEDEFDEALAFECGLPNEEYVSGDYLDFDSEWSRFRYIQDQWECSNCGTLEWNTEGERYYWNPESGYFDGEKPISPNERAALENQRQEMFGQTRLM